VKLFTRICHQVRMYAAVIFGLSADYF